MKCGLGAKVGGPFGRGAKDGALLGLGKDVGKGGLGDPDAEGRPFPKLIGPGKPENEGWDCVGCGLNEADGPKGFWRVWGLNGATEGPCLGSCCS